MLRRQSPSQNGNSATESAISSSIVEMLEPLEERRTAALSDPYCIGFLQIVGVHAASKPLGSGGGMGQA